MVSNLEVLVSDHIAPPFSQISEQRRLNRVVISPRLPCLDGLLAFCHGLGLGIHSSFYGVEESGVVVLDRKIMGKLLDFLYLTL